MDTIEPHLRQRMSEDLGTFSLPHAFDNCLTHTTQNTGDPSLLRQLDEPYNYEAEQLQFASLPRKTSTRKRKQVMMKNTELSQKFGVLAIGETICREFGFDGVFYGTINAFRREGETELYTVRYTDGDQEDLDLEEYNFAYALWLQQEVWDVDEDDGIEESRSESGSEEDYCDEVPLVQEVKLIKKK